MSNAQIAFSSQYLSNPLHSIHLNGHVCSSSPWRVDSLKLIKKKKKLQQYIVVFTITMWAGERASMRFINSFVLCFACFSVVVTEVLLHNHSVCRFQILLLCALKETQTEWLADCYIKKIKNFVRKRKTELWKMRLV